MMFPSVFGENLFDDWMDDFGFNDNFFSGKNPLYGKHAKNIMKTDVRETDQGYELDVDLPGFKKDEVQVQLKDGYLTISTAKGLDKDEQDKKGNYIRRERLGRQSPRQERKGQRGSLHPAGALERLVQQKLLCRQWPEERGCTCEI